MKPNISGKSNEIMVVMNNYLWKSEIGDMVHDTLTRVQPGLPQPEPYFDLYHIEHNTLSKFTQVHRNILIIDISDKYKAPIFKVEKNVWARSQLVIRMYAPDKTSFIQLFNEKDKELQHLFLHIERTRLMNIYKNNLKAEVRDAVLEKHQVELLVPDGFYVNINTDNFTWLWHEDPDIIQGIIVYEYPYTDTNTFTSEYLVKKRNEFTRHNIPGSSEGSYMTTELLYEPQFRELMYKDRYFAELRGLWKVVDGQFMGGPFVSLSTVDEKRNRVVTVEGFVYAGGKSKRNYLRQVEAIIYSLKIK